ncbi:MAG TPA: beta-glucosidase BglX [Opitutaceae bacterium]|jgi:beta-glucosidase|nr:beta-glucosidase BglX [Opitutaceae bacterium]
MRLSRIGFAAALTILTVGRARAADDARIDSLMAQMTLEEKVGQLNQLAAGFLPGPILGNETGEALVKQGLVGSVLSPESYYQTQLYQKEAVEDSRLHIPLLFGLDVIHGYRTIFPIPLGLSCSWDMDVIEQTARFAAREASAQGVRWTFSPMVDIARDPRWGRITEGAGEDPYLGSAIARAYVRGYQGSRLDDPTSILACAKHFVGYGAVEGGREYNTTEISERTLRGIYLPPFKAAVDQGCATVMSAFNLLDEVPASANPFTLDGILKGEWRFPGFVVSDWTAVRELEQHGIADDDATAARKSFLAGVDMDMESAIFLPQLPALVRSGAVPQARVDEAVRRILRAKAALGLFDHPYTAEPSGPAGLTPEGRALARRAAAESLVLLENRPVGTDTLLPLAAAAGKKIALIGPLADSPRDMLGSWPCAGDPHDVVTLRQALTERAQAAGMRLTYAPGSGVGSAADNGYGEAIDAAENADVAIVALGEASSATGEASSRSTLDLPGSQQALLQGVVNTGVPVVLVIFSGRPLALPWAAENVNAMLWAWFPGVEAGHAVADALFGDVNPAGRLTVSVPRSVGQVPIYYDAFNTGRPRSDVLSMGTRTQDAHYVTGYIDLPDTPLYPFGYGLGYTRFGYSAVSVDAAALSARALNDGSARFHVAADVTNQGSREGTEIVQLYIRQRGTSVARPDRELKGFRRITLRPGETRRVDFTLGRDELAFWNIDMKDVVEPGQLFIWVTANSAVGVPARVAITP